MIKTSTLAVILAALIISVVFTGEADGAGLVKRAISTVGTWAVSDIPSLPASKITSGTFAKTMISSSGTFPWSEISKTSSSIHDLANVTSIGCAVGQVLKVSGTTWQCAADNTGAGGITSINGDSTAAQVFSGTANNMTITDTGAGTLQFNLASNVLTTGGSAQTITKGLTINSGVLGGQLNIAGNTFLNTGTITFPTATGTLATLDGSETLSGKTLTTPIINGIELANSAKTGAYTLTTTDDVITVAPSANPTSYTLPTAVGNTGKIFWIKKTDNTVNVARIITTSSQTIDGFSNFNLTYNKASIIVQSDGSNWQKLNNDNLDLWSFHRKGVTENRWYGTAQTTSTTATLAPPTTTLNAYPFILGSTTTFDRIEIDVAVGVAGSTCRAGIYRDTGNVYPANLVAGSDVGTISGVTAARVGNTFASPITLQPELYWLATQCSTATTITLRSWSVNAVPAVLGYISTTTASSMGTGWSATLTYAAFPSAYPAGAAVILTAPHQILLRATG